MAKLSSLVKKYKGDIAKVHRGASLELGNRVVASTPVDTGRARASWSALNGAPKLGVPYLFGSSLDYIIALEYGHSPQARNPDGMLRINAANWPSIVFSRIR